MQDYQFECQTCGLLMEVGMDEIDFDSPIVTCPKCSSHWAVEPYPGEPWLEPIEELRY